MNRPRAVRLLVVAVAAAGLSTASAHAADGLGDAVSRLPDTVAQTPSGLMFEFVSPSAVASWALRDRPGISDDGLREALARPDAAAQRTGIAFADLDAILVAGDPPHTLIYLAGPKIAPDAVSAALQARNFDESREGGATVFARGDDFALDLTSVDRADPFGGRLGSAERVAVVPGRVLSARGWTDLRPALAMLAGSETYLGTRLARMVAAAAKDAGPGMTVDTAFGITVVATAGGALPLAPDGTLDFSKPIAAPRQAMPPYLFAILIGAEAADGAAVAQIALYYPTLADAQGGGAAVAKGAADFKKIKGFTYAATATAIADDPGAIAVVTVRVAGGMAHPSEAVRRRWIEGIYRREFTPLAVFQ